ncbi:hypothetical protein Rhe02_37720 [Rhizocola hellebori]|uniref:Uncharacterized protein n=1 Tax=Rhizocola hellebori TaxID=1392758 RepID=A0A8J3Q9V1_9ACTN|nr:hypothetical protein [Rhizocola hellebori]GIH05705.1 hypothetical protein Rhe02_37720 [Rhizocola hellebori]
MNRPAVKYVLLYRTPTRWRISVAEIPDAFGCGHLPGTAPDVPVEDAQQDLLRHLRRHWQFTGGLSWEQTGPDSWAANAVAPGG